MPYVNVCAPPWYVLLYGAQSQPPVHAIHLPPQLMPLSNTTSSTLPPPDPRSTLAFNGTT